MVPQNCRFLSLVVVERVLTTHFLILKSFQKFLWIFCGHVFFLWLPLQTKIQIESCQIDGREVTGRYTCFFLQENAWSLSHRVTNQHPHLPWNFMTHGFLGPSAFLLSVATPAEPRGKKTHCFCCANWVCEKLLEKCRWEIWSGVRGAWKSFWTRFGLFFGFFFALFKQSFVSIWKRRLFWGQLRSADVPP